MPDIKCPSCNATHHIGFRELVDKQQVFSFRITTKHGSMIRAELFAETMKGVTTMAQEIAKNQGNPLAGYFAGARFGDGFVEADLVFIEMATEEDVRRSVSPGVGGCGGVESGGDGKQ